MIKLLGCAVFSYSKNKERVNQDSVLSPQKLGNGYIMAVADGVGSYKGADRASNIAIDFLSKIKTSFETFRVEETFVSIKHEVSNLTLENEILHNAATTLTFCYVDDTGLQIGHIGDCRAYLKKGNKLVQLTKDHTQYQKLLDDGIYKEHELKNISIKNTLITAISKEVDISYQSTFIPYKELLQGESTIDIFIMSDGAYKFWEKRPKFSPNTLSDPNRFAASLYKRITRHDAIDDYTLVAAKLSI